MNEESKRKGRPPFYPYDKWTDGKWRQVDASDYDTTGFQFRRTIGFWSRRHGYRLTSTVSGNIVRFCIWDPTIHTGA